MALCKLARGGGRGDWTAPRGFNLVPSFLPGTPPQFLSCSKAKRGEARARPNLRKEDTTVREKIESATKFAEEMASLATEKLDNENPLYTQMWDAVYAKVLNEQLELGMNV